MPIEVTCPCGSRLKAKDDLAGKTVRCPTCKKPLKIPAMAPVDRPASRQAVPQSPEGRTRLKCRCGKVLSVPDSVRGKVVRCPACKAQLKIPLPTETSPAPTKTVTPPVEENFGLSSLFDEIGDEMAASEADPSVKLKPPKPKRVKAPKKPRAKKPKKKSRGGSGYGADDDLTGVDWILAIFCGGIACILGVLWVIQGKPKGLKMLGVCFLMTIIWTVIQIAVSVLMVGGGAAR